MAPIQLIHDTTIVTADDAGSILYDAALAVRDGRIAALGPTAELRAKFPDAERIDARGRAVFPGFANTHTHLSRVLARGIYEDLSPSHTPPFTGGLAPLPLPALSPDEERVMVLLGALEAIRSGTTLVLGESAGLDSYAGALVDTGLRVGIWKGGWGCFFGRARGTARPLRSAGGARSRSIRRSPRPDWRGSPTFTRA